MSRLDDYLLSVLAIAIGKIEDEEPLLRTAKRIFDLAFVGLLLGRDEGHLSNAEFELLKSRLDSVQQAALGSRPQDEEC